ncbi:MAG: ABC transporter permease [Defluviitaleaceae bacterium]|nr:ABC transporter permease [Defluviitaleaceae bacterium]
MNTEFKYSLRLTRFILRRERVVSVVWIVIIAAMCLIVPLAFSQIYSDASGLAAIGTMMSSPSMVAMAGPYYSASLPNLTIGSFNAGMMLLYSAMAVAVMNIFLVVRHSRRDEERGRLEVVRSLPVGRLSNITSVMAVAFIMNLIISLVVGFGMAALRVDGIGLQDGLVFGFAMGVCGLFFAAATALISQIFSSSRSAIGVSFVVLAVAYILRAYGDVSSEAAARISPLGLILRVQASVNDYWWPIVALLIVSIIVAAIAFYLNSLRDMDQGFISAKPGRAEASRALQSPLGFALRLERGTLIGWAAVMFILGIMYGSIMASLPQFMNSSDMIKQLFAITSTDTTQAAHMFTAKMLSMYAIVSVIPALIVLFKLRGEETRDRLEQIYARPVSRTRMMGVFYGISAVTGVVMLLLYAVGYYAAGYATAPELVDFGQIMKGSLVYIPALLCTCGLAAFILGLIPRLQIVNWIYLGITFLLVYMGDILLKDYPGAKKISPFGNIPLVGIDQVKAWVLILLVVIAAALAAAGFVFYRRRDLKA